ncbi:urea ABC transporter permease subunit UrtC [Paenibacillus turpanensis]|uniref:urea ABC transporter permease subunit UrtC n=1 Tax=Paenibacillus turpanensis TaxID=2689078 RepID=UPI00140945D2|nr:urea ABC transporter permease subunit UrtC [Paenibacillus turpanensis]
MLQRNAFSTKTKLLLTAGLIILMMVAPLFLSEFRLSLLGKYLSYAILAIGIDLIWGYTGIMSLGHGVFFGLGAYCTAMHLKLVASGGGLPDFMSWSGVESLPWFWKPFESAGFAILMSMVVPVIVAAILGYFTFRNRIKGTFFAILSQALVIVMYTLFVGQQGYTGGTNGLTNFDSFLGMPLGTAESKIILYYATAVLLVIVFFLSRALVKGRLGKVLTAIRDGENRVRFLGFNPVVYKLFVYCLSAALAGLAGTMFILQEGIISPAQMSIVPSIEMVLWVAIGGRATLIGAIIGAVVTNAAKSGFSEMFPDGWLFFLGGLFVVTVLFLPKGIVGSIMDVWNKAMAKRRASNEHSYSESPAAGTIAAGSSTRS